MLADGNYAYFYLFYLWLCESLLYDNNRLISSASAQKNSSGPNIQTSVPGNPVVSMAGTNLNVGMDLWNPSVANGPMKMRPNASRTAVPPSMMGRDGMMPDQWVQVLINEVI